MSYGKGVVEQLPSGKYRVRVPDGHGKYKSCGTYYSESEANKMLAAAVIAKGRGGSLSQSIGEYGEVVIMRWKASGKKSWEDDHSRWKCWVIEHAEWARDPIDDIARGEIKDWARSLLTADSDRDKPLANRTIKNIVALVRQVFAEAVEDEFIELSPAIGFKIPKRTNAEEDHWTALSQEEIQTLLQHPMFSIEQRTAFALCIYAGLRQGECAALCWPDVRNLDGADPHLIIRRSWDTTPKNGKTRRVELIPAAVSWLKNWRSHAEGSPSQCVWGHVYSRGYDWGWAASKDYYNGVCWLGARRVAGIERKFWFHHLRDTCASHLLTGSWGRAWTIAEVATMLGHSTTWVTERYARVLPGHMALIAAATSSHGPTTMNVLDSQKTPENKGRAQQESNLQHSVPKTKVRNEVSVTCADRGRSVEDLAESYLRIIDAGVSGAKETEAAHALADAVLSYKDVQLALSVKASGPNARVAAIELAGLNLAATKTQATKS